MIRWLTTVGPLVAAGLILITTAAWADAGVFHLGVAAAVILGTLGLVRLFIAWED